MHVKARDEEDDVMTQKDKRQYQVDTGPYRDKTNGLKFGYEYSSGNKTDANEVAQNISDNKDKEAE